MSESDEARVVSEQTGYSLVARIFHWTTVAFVAVLVPVGLYMTYRGKELNLWDATTNTLYSGHKLAGFTLLCLIVLRLIYRVFAGAPDHEPSLSTFHIVASKITHWAIYAVLIAMPLAGWIGVSAFPALDTFGGLKLPALVAPDKDLAAQAFAVHGLLGYALMALVAVHVGAALYHHIVLRNSVLTRMTSGRPRS